MASGATPAMPTPFSAPAIVVATCVPWPWRSWTAALFEQSPFAISCGAAVGVSSKMNEHDRATSRLPARSGCVRSTPPSITPTVTPAPVAFAYESAPASIRRMSHWHAESGSGPALTPKNASQFADACAGVSAPGVAACTGAIDPTISATSPASTVSLRTWSPSLQGRVPLGRARWRGVSRVPFASYRAIG